MLAVTMSISDVPTTGGTSGTFALSFVPFLAQHQPLAAALFFRLRPRTLIVPGEVFRHLLNLRAIGCGGWADQDNLALSDIGRRIDFLQVAEERDASDRPKCLCHLSQMSLG
jgi:hypothetical protein